MVEQAFAEATVLGAEGKRADLAGDVQQIKKSRAASRTGPYKHLMTGVSYMLPFVVAGGLLIALPPADADHLEELYHDAGQPVWRVGEVVEGHGVEVVPQFTRQQE